MRFMLIPLLLFLTGCQTHVDGAANRAAVAFAEALIDDESGRLIKGYELKKLTVQALKGDGDLFHLREKLTNALIQETALRAFDREAEKQRGLVTGRMTAGYDPLALAVEVRFEGQVRNARSGEVVLSERVRGRFGPTLLEWAGGLGAALVWSGLLFFVTKTNAFYGPTPRMRLRRKILAAFGALVFLALAELTAAWALLQAGML